MSNLLTLNKQSFKAFETYPPNPKWPLCSFYCLDTKCCEFHENTTTVKISSTLKYRTSVE